MPSDISVKTKILILADDLTGALEAGAAFAPRGIETIVTLRQLPVSKAPVLVIDTETRHVPAEEAALLVDHFLQSVPARLRYKKTDSTLRGNIRAELTALARWGPVTYVPAYPQLGRTLRQGCLYVDDVPIERTVFAQDPLHPITEGNLTKLLDHCSGITLSEANTEDEIEEIARGWICTGGSAAGPSALLHAAVKLMGGKKSPPPFPAVRRALVVSASRHENSRRQLAVASRLFCKSGWGVLEATQEYQGDPRKFIAGFGQRAAQQLQPGSFDTLIVFGGDTACSILQALDITTVEPLGEVVPGVPVSLLPNGLTLVTKAGGFGSPEILLQLYEKLTHV